MRESEDQDEAERARLIQQSAREAERLRQEHRGLEELERRVDSGEMAAAFALFPVSMDQLLGIADAGEIMPPKTTWFEPKLRSGLFVHDLE